MTVATASGAALLSFARVTKWFGTVAALMDVSFDVGQEVVGLVGRNGVGKSTLMKLAAGLITPSQGHVTVAGKPAGSKAARGSSPPATACWMRGAGAGTRS